MPNQTPNRNRSLGKLRPQPTTKPKSPDGAGTICIKRDLLLHLYQQLSQSDDDEIVANIAGWFNEDGSGKYMTIELSVKYPRSEYRNDSPFFAFH
jgi:hypothetical protein